MKKSNYLILVTITISAIIVYSLINSNTGIKSINTKYKNFVLTKGVIAEKKNILGPKARLITNYSVRFTDNEKKKYLKTSNDLGGSYKTGDTVTIFYNPKNPYDAIIDESNKEENPDAKNYNKTIIYTISIIILVITLIYSNRKRTTG